MKNTRLILFMVTGALMLLVIFGVDFITAHSIAFAQINDGKIHNPLGSTTTLSQVLGIVISSVQVIAGVLSVVFIIIAGLKFVLANGDPAKIKTAKSMLLYVVIGIAIIFGAQAIAIVVQTTIKQVGSGQ